MKQEASAEWLHMSAKGIMARVLVEGRNTERESNIENAHRNCSRLYTLPGNSSASFLNTVSWSCLKALLMSALRFLVAPTRGEFGTRVVSSDSGQKMLQFTSSGRMLMYGAQNDLGPLLRSWRRYRDRSTKSSTGRPLKGLPMGDRRATSRVIMSFGGTLTTTSPSSISRFATKPLPVSLKYAIDTNESCFSVRPLSTSQSISSLMPSTPSTFFLVGADATQDTSKG
mmetsp:Transcript_16014/g.27575  ORF Transcript_16014/g.27575 Transcript_16014/m.27575 type:complete len:227 (+) Transcript_16014:344-1024(+)